MQSSSWLDVNMISSEASSVVIDIAQNTQKKTQTVRPPNAVPYVQTRFKDFTSPSGRRSHCP